MNQPAESYARDGNPGIVTLNTYWAILVPDPGQLESTVAAILITEPGKM